MLDVLYEDDAFLFINKPPGIVIQPSLKPEEPYLLEEVLQHAPGAFLMQRLDRGTSGVMFFSKMSSINAKLTRQFETKEIRKRYLALVRGELGERQIIDAPLARVGAIKFAVRDDGKRAVTVVTPRRATPRRSPARSAPAAPIRSASIWQRSGIRSSAIGCTARAMPRGRCSIRPSSS